ncbi:MAG: DUF2730 family protein [Aquamicrobium sp.]|nr:DUF2730 family protein [Aquamicrobium sp.]
MDIAAIVPYLTAANTALALGVWVYAGLTRGSRDNADALRGLRERQNEAERNIQALQNELKHLPDAQDVVELKLSITEMRGAMNTQAEVMGSVARTVQRLETYLMEKGK